MSNKPKTRRIEHLAGRDIHVHHHGSDAPAAPPADAAQAMACPQCHQLTWRHSRYCVHCRLDLRLWRASLLIASAVAVVPVLGYLTLQAIARARIDRVRRLD